ncbi:IQ and ubiquitin-like domain-containing protein [Melanotaenia boesemani]|uniref:IQ and ubiquitin-like domain-containing protein n=1 Tax=Melanotaenia boesemani TaxID=1250792 RepID=UPI001C048BB6|nr:IQ and ubiquitin-like domain-containing protein [Melanotaenia boesemani]
MSVQREVIEQIVEEEEDENGEENLQTVGNAVGEPLGGDGEEVPAVEVEDGEEAGTQADSLDDMARLQEPQEKENVEAAVVDPVEENQNDSAEKAEQLKTENAGNSTATVKVVLVPEGHVMTVAFAIGLSIQELKRHLASELRVPVEVLQLSLDDKVVEEHQSLMQLGIRPHSSTRMEMSSTNPDSHPLRPLRPPQHNSMPDVITVRVQTDEGVFKEVVVEIERPSQQKTFLGGYRHRLTGAEYHHAAVQTLPKKRPDRGVAVFSRDSQTVELKSQVQQCPVNVSTQMTGIGCYVSCVNDKLVSPGKYITADEYHNRRVKAVICLQSFARRWLAQQAVDQLRRERTRRLAWLELQEKRRQEEKEEQLRDRRQRWMNPQKKEDFNLLYNALEKWRSEEEQQINSSLRGAERKNALCSLLEEEVKLIAAIGRHRVTMETNNYDKVIQNFLNKSAAPYQWRGADGRLIEMDTQFIIRARELRDLYNNISLFTVNKEQRIHFLMTLKHTVMECECQLTRDIVDLIDREVDLMTRGLKARSLEGLRQRICTLFLQYIKTPAFNPNVAKLLKVPQNPNQLKNDMFLCRGCHRYLRSASFTASASGCLSRMCKHCTRLNNIARPRDDFTLYKNILRRLRDEEQSLNNKATFPFLLQVEDIQYLIEVLWESCSALNGSSDLFNLVFVRWERQRDWSPWNCILLSKEETKAHLELEDVHQTYEKTFIRGVKHKHAMARQHFSQIPVMAKCLNSHLSAPQGN